MNFGCVEKLPDAPAGRYFVFDIESDFARLDVTERIVVGLEQGQWKIVGYFRTKSVTLGVSEDS